MPVKGGCLLFDTPLKEALEVVVKRIAYDNLVNSKSASVGSIYRLLKAAGVEIDLPTVGEIYNNVLPRDDANFSSETEIDDYVGRTWNNDLLRITEMEDLVGEIQIKDEKPERAVVEFLMRAFYSNVVTDARTTSDMKALQTALTNGIKRKLGKLDSKQASKQSMVDLINEAFSWEEKGITDVNGQLNSIEDLFNYMKQELQSASREIRESEDENVVDRWNEYVKNLETATYQVLFRKNDALKVRNQALTDGGFGAKNGGLDWNKLAAYGSVVTLRRNAINSFVAAGFTNNQATRVADTLEQEFVDLRAEIIERQYEKAEEYAKKAKNLSLNNAGLKQLLGGKTMANWIKEQNVETVEQLAEVAYTELNKMEYVPLVKRKAVAELEKFFNENYAKVDQVEAQRVIDSILGKGTPQEKTVTEWIKANGIQNQDELYQQIDAALSGRNISPQNDALIRSEFGRILDINNRAEKELRTKEEAIAKVKEYKPAKSDLKRLIELYHLGVFDSTYDASLFKVLGVEALQIQDIEDIKSFAKAASNLARSIVSVKGYNLTNDSAVATEFQFIQRAIDRIIERNVNNKSRGLRIVTFLKNYLSVMLSSLLAMPFTLVENIFSGFKAVLSGIRYGNFNTTQTKQAIQVYFAMLKDVTRTGQAYGEEIGSFATQELFLNTLRFKWKNATIQDRAKSILLGVTMPIRLGLLAFDSANKVALTNKIFINNVQGALMKHNGWTRNETSQAMNEMFYGKKFEDAKALAKKIAEDRNASLPLHLREKITEPYIIRLANDIVKANLITGGVFIKDGVDASAGIADAVVKGAYHVAGVALGHEPNNPFSRAIKNYRDARRKNEQKYVTAKDWKGLAKHNLMTAFMNNFVVKFAGGATNWLVLRAKEGLGLGLVWGWTHEWNKDVDYFSNENLKRDIEAREKARSDIARNAVGITYAILFNFLGFGLFGSGDDEKTRKRLKELNDKPGKKQKDYEEIESLKSKINAYTSLKANKDKDKWFRRLAPDVHLIKYYIENSGEEGGLGNAIGIFEYFSRTFLANNKFSTAQKILDAGALFYQKDVDAALGTLASIIGSDFSTPMWRPYKEYIRVVSNPFRKDKIPPSRYVPPTNISEGFFSGGLLQDLGFFDNPSITSMPGIGIKTYEKFKKRGIKNIDDLDKHKNWDKMTDEKGNLILNSDDMYKAKKWLEEYKKRN